MNEEYLIIEGPQMSEQHDIDGLSSFRQKLNSIQNSSSSQEHRSELREKFLNVLQHLYSSSSPSVQLDFHREASLTAKYSASDSSFSQLLVQDLQTPIGVMTNALIRTNDLTALNFTLVKQ
ncbi:unnamed protein product [Didymodactylos carnosus]|uniref:Uncharacterized protein n=1 Tax=Didymodactylos carnosus TaxID=1234261 RepID=A0A8S2R9X6_9BILA|nr:unnamed protein product [Didymodactylos carnosus]CAF4152516.1 unnamed protein product [Didymodactylos carnosus]